MSIDLHVQLFGDQAPVMRCAFPMMVCPDDHDRVVKDTTVEINPSCGVS
jgi:hypothetical protein